MRKIHRNMARMIGGFFCAFLMALCPVRTAMCAEQPKLDLYAASAVLLDADSGRVLYEKNGYAPMAMASTTKIMTCILILEEGDLDEMAEVSEYAAAMPKVKLYVRKGEKYQVRNLLFSMMLESHNDSAVVLAEHFGRKLLPGELREKSAAECTAEESRQAVKAFVSRMNGKAREIGCEQTWFVTPNGLDGSETVTTETGENVEREHSTTAAELAKIMAYCVQKSPEREKFRAITRTASFSFTENGRSFSCANHNAFLHMMEGAFSGKTGFTNKAGYCYVGALERDGRTFIVALLACGWPNNKGYKWKDAGKLLSYGVDHYTYRKFLDAGTAYDADKLKPLPVENGQTDRLGAEACTGVEILGRSDAARERGLLMRQDEGIRVECRVKSGLQAPVKAGTVVGNIQYSVDGEVYYTEAIAVTDSVNAVDLPWCMRMIWDRFALFSREKDV